MTKKDCRSGYTLMEVAVVVFVAGVMMSSFMLCYHVYQQKVAKDKNITNVSLVAKAIGNHLIQRGSYPCPSRLDLPRGDPNYGIAGSCADTSQASGTCVNGICIEESDPMSSPPTPPAAPETRRVRRGAVPFRTLNLPEEYAEDGYKIRLEYAVTEKLAVVYTYDKNGGGIDVKDGAGRTKVMPEGTAHFIIISRGETRKGGYSKLGKMGEPCAVSVPTLDSENCNTDTTSLRKKPLYISAPVSTAPGTGFFDDYVLYDTSVDTPFWKVADDDGLHIRDLVKAEEGPVVGGRVGIGSGDLATVDVAGNVKTSDNLLTDEICGKSGTDCMTTDLIAGDRPEMQCPNDPAFPLNRFVAGFRNNRAVCVIDLEFRCPAGQVMTGINSDGTLVCSSSQRCPAGPDWVCTCGNPASCTPAYDSSLPDGVEGQVVYNTGGYSKVQKLRCESGSWRWKDDWGTCDVCVPGASTHNHDCDENDGSGTWTGDARHTYTTTCPDGTETSTWDRSACVCTNTVETDTETCPAGETGTRQRQRAWTCTSATAGSWGSWTWVDPPSVCTCTGTRETRSVTCPTGYTGSGRDEYRDITCSPTIIGSWTPTPGGDHCTCGATETQTVSCGPGQTGTKTQSRTFNCAISAWGLWSDVDTTACVGTSYVWKSSSAPNPASSPTGVKEGDGCTAPTSHLPCWNYAPPPGYYNFPDCTCE